METVLITCIGSTPAISIAKALKNKFNLVGIDIDEICAGKNFTNEFILCPKISSTVYFDFIKNICKTHNIKYIFVTHQIELIYWSDKTIDDVVIFCNNFKCTNICSNKLLTQQLCENNNILQPMLYNETNLTFPCIVKPISGSGSVGVEILESFDEYLVYKHKCKSEFICQEYVKGIEYTIDFVKTKNVIHVVPKKRIEIKNGQAVKSITVNNSDLINYAKNIVEIFEIDYMGNVQVMEKDNKFYLIEVNAKFAASLPLTTEAGINMPELLIESTKNMIFKNINFEEGLTMARFHQEYFIR